MLTHYTMDGQMHSIGKAIRPLFTDPVTYKAGFRVIFWGKKCLTFMIHHIYSTTVLYRTKRALSIVAIL